MLTITTLIDRTPDGSPKRTSNGYYRFSIIVRSDDAPALVVRGFRIAPPFHRIQPPISQWRDSIYSCVELSRSLEDQLIAQLKAELGPAPAGDQPH